MLNLNSNLKFLFVLIGFKVVNMTIMYNLPAYKWCINAKLMTQRSKCFITKYIYLNKIINQVYGDDL